MKRFCINIVAFSLIFVMLAGGFVLFDQTVVKNQYTTNYQASFVDKMTRLASLPSPKIILVGDSSLAFGMQSKLLEEAMQMPVVNLGIHGGLGNAFQEEMAKLNLEKGDIVIVCHHDYSDIDNSIADLELAWITLEKHREFYGFLRKEDYKPLLRAYPRYLFRSFLLWASFQGNKPVGGSYSRDAFNAYGDVQVRTPQTIDPALRFRVKPAKPPQINDVCMERLNAYNAFIQDKGAVLLIAGYPIGDGEYTAPKSEFQAFEEALRQQVDCPVISDFTDYMFPYHYFYDTVYHLTEEGARRRTEQLILDLKKWQNTKNTQEK